MKYSYINRKLNRMSRIVLGGRFGEQPDELSIELLNKYVSLGGNTIDTANQYADGKSEIIIGKWFQIKDNRSDIFLIDKGCHPSETFPDKSRVTKKAIHEDIDQSLSRLQTSYIDLFLLHRDDESVPVETIIDALNEEVLRGRILSFGASNWRCERIEKANRYADMNGIEGFSVSSCGFSLAVPNEPMWKGAMHINADSLEWHIKNKMPLLAWSSQARGWFSGQYINREKYDADVERVYNTEENRKRLSRTLTLANHMQTSAIKIALAYLLHKNESVSAIIGPQTVLELEESIGALEIELSDEQIRYLESGA